MSGFDLSSVDQPESGGGGGGDASAANQSTMITALNAIETAAEAIQTSAASLVTATDGLEASVDGLEAATDGLEALLARPTIVIEPVSADETIAAANWLWGYSIWNTDAGVSEVTIHNGDASNDPLLVSFRLAEDESTTIVLPERLPCADGIRFEVVSGAVAGAVFYEA